MSHTSTISSIKIIDILAFNQAVEQLQQEGVGITVVHNEVPHGYFPDQAGMNEVALQVLKIDGADHDVALYDIGNGQHELRTDFYGGTVQNKLGARADAIAKIDTSTTEGCEEVEQARLGRLYQLYALNAISNTTARTGGSIQQELLADGSIQLVIAA